MSIDIDYGFHYVPKHTDYLPVRACSAIREFIFGSKKMQEQQVDVVIAIGSVIKGETQHFNFVCDGVTQGIKDLNVLNDVPVVFCLLTDNSLQQSIDRSGGKHGNKGVEAAITAIKMAHLCANM